MIGAARYVRSRQRSEAPATRCVQNTARLQVTHYMYQWEGAIFTRAQVIPTRVAKYVVVGYDSDRAHTTLNFIINANGATLTPVIILMAANTPWGLAANASVIEELPEANFILTESCNLTLESFYATMVYFI